jgi:hypothetical protein
VKGEVDMKKPAILLTLTVTLAVFALIASAQAQVTASIQVKDQNGTVLNGQTVHLNTKIKVYGTYNDFGSHTPALYTIGIYLDTGSGFNLITGWTGTVQSGHTAESPQYTLNQLGTYEFRFSVTSGAIISCFEKARASTRIQLTVPEPATLAALTMGLGALGLFAFKKKRTK